jgi:endonuclease/exonuclease/phosphatase (EEP) superfamily protein YafD
MRWFDRAVLIAAAAVAVASLLPLGARSWWILDLTTHFRVQYLAVALPLLGLAVVRKLWPACVALVIVSVVNALPVLPYLPRPATLALDVRATATPLKVAAINISFLQFSARRLREIVAEAAPDVLLLVEFTPYAAEVLAALDSQFPYRLKLPADGPYGLALLSRLELESAERLRLGRVPAIRARVRSAAGAFTLLGVHLSAPTTPQRAAQRNTELKQLPRAAPRHKAPSSLPATST